MLTTGQRQMMIAVAGVIVGFLLSFLILNIFNLTPNNSSVGVRAGVVVGFVIIGIIAALILEKATRKGYCAVFAGGKNPVLEANAKIPAWYTKTRMNRSSYWLISLLMAVFFFGGAFVAYGAIPYPASGYVIGLFAVIFLALRLFLVRFRLNDISPDKQIDLAKRGGMGIAGRWLIDFAPSHKGSESSFAETQKFYLADGKPNVQNFFLNLRNFLFLVIVIALIFFLLAVLK